MKADLILHNCGQLVTCASAEKPKRRAEMRDVGMIDNGAVAIVERKFAAVGRSTEILRNYQSDHVLDVGGKVVCPGFVDPHTHIVYAGDRLDEFEQKIAGSDYLEILAKGGGIISTVKKTREATVADLIQNGRKHLDRMLACGTTTCEIKTGYGLDTDTELKMLAAIAELDKPHPISIVPTFLAAHAVPPEFRANANGYVDLICNTMLPAAWKWFVESPFHGRVPFFADVFCEKNAFDLEQTRKVLETARSFGFKLKIHADEFTNLGGSRLAIQMGATSIDHLDMISDDEIVLLAKSRTIGVVTPTVNFNLGSSSFADARKLIDDGCAIALSTDYNPGSAPCPSQAMTMAIACRYQKLTPAEALNGATINAACAIGVEKTTGSIEVGKQADLLVLDTHDYRAIAYEFGASLVSTVIKGGSAVV
jgi:imidazolonepropionase